MKPRSHRKHYDMFREEPVRRNVKVGDVNYQDWRCGGVLHRTDGPAIICEDGQVDWWYRGKQYGSNINSWAKAVGIFDTDEFVMLKLEYG